MTPTPIALLKAELEKIEKHLAFLLSLDPSQRRDDEFRTIREHKAEIRLYKHSIRKLKK